jgi:hypothetical protein
VLSSGGEFPNSIAVHGNLVYVANAGGAGSVSGFWIVGQRVLPIPGSTRSLGLDDTNPSNFHDGPGQVIFSSARPLRACWPKIRTSKGSTSSPRREPRDPA